MIAPPLAPYRHDAEVAARFDAAEARFKPSVATDDVRLTALIRAIGPLEGRRLLDLGCGKGRFATRLVALGAEVVGIDVAGGDARRCTWDRPGQSVRSASSVC